MANPQKENGYTGISNEIMDKLCSIRISGVEWQLIFVVLRKTYGWNKKKDEISLSQFVKMTGLKKPNVCRELKKLVEKGVINVIKNDNRKPDTYWFVKDFSKWKTLPKKITLTKMITSVNKNDNQSLSFLSTTKDTSTKTNITKESEIQNFNSTHPQQGINSRCPNVINFHITGEIEALLEINNFPDKEFKILLRDFCDYNSGKYCEDWPARLKIWINRSVRNKSEKNKDGTSKIEDQIARLCT